MARSLPRKQPVVAATPAARTATTPVAAVLTGTVQLAISPWGQVEVDGAAAGVTPPLTRLTLPEGSHHITIRNADSPPYVTTIEVQADRLLTLRHRFAP